MSRVYKKVLGLACLSLVVGMTAVAAGLPDAQNNAAAAASDVTVSFKINNSNNPLLVLSAPAENSIHYDNNIVNLDVDYAHITNLVVAISGPNGYATSFNYAPSENSGDISYPLDLDNYGEYTIVLTGEGINGNPISPIIQKFNYHAITTSDNGNGNIHVDYGPATCKLSFQAYDIDDTDMLNPLLDPPYTVDDLTVLPGAPNFADIEVPGLASLGNREFKVVVTAYDCLDAEPLEEADTTTQGLIEPPKTGALNILGLTISHIDYLATGLISFGSIALFAIFLARRKKSQGRR